MKSKTKKQRQKIYEGALYLVSDIFGICTSVFLVSRMEDSYKLYIHFPELVLFSPVAIDDCNYRFWFDTKEERQTALLFMIEICKGK